MAKLFKFCPSCKSILPPIVKRMIDCPHCGFRFYLSPATSIGVIIENEKQEILLVKRKNPPKIGWWDLPGGFIEWDESSEESVRREIREELGFNIKNFRYLASYPDHYLFKGTNYHTLCIVFAAKITGEKLTVADDIAGFRFFPKKRISEGHLAFKYIKQAINAYLSLS